MKAIYIISTIILVLAGVSLFVLFVMPDMMSNSHFSTSNNTNENATKYKEIVNPGGFVNTNDQPIKIADYVGKKVILLDVMTYSCINCQRTFPYVTAWYEKYKDEGLIVIGIHTPEFAFEKNKANVEEAMKRFGITFPVVLDNDYGTWNAYGNKYWPRKYLIDIHGNVVYDHIGEGGYEETEEKIQDLLAERATVLGEDVEMPDELAASSIEEVKTAARSPETYFGSARNEFLGNGIAGSEGARQFEVPASVKPNMLYLTGAWTLVSERGEASSGASIIYKYNAKEVYIVADADSAVEVEVWQDGKRVSREGGEDVENGSMQVSESRLYKVIRNGSAGEHTLELKIKGSARFYAFTFG